MDYLEHVLGIRVMYINRALPSMPNYLLSRYHVQEVSLGGKRAVFVFPKEELDPVDVLKKHLDRIEKIMNVKAVLVPERMTYREREYLLREHIPFIVEGRQIYLPFMAIYLQERFDSERQMTTKLLPSAQLLLLYYIYQGCGEVLTSTAARELSFTATSISRASRQLEELGLLKAEKRGVHKVLFSGKQPQELFEDAKDYLMNPVKRTIYVDKKNMRENLLLSSYSALSEYSMLNPPEVQYYASPSISGWEESASNSLRHAADQYAVELWRYDPVKLADGECVDRLSLALALRDDRDERTEEAVEEMLAGLWRVLNGKRN